MDSTLIETAVSQGIWAMLFVALFVWEIKQSSAREAKYQELLNKLSEKYNDLKDGIDDIKNILGGRG